MVIGEKHKETVSVTIENIDLIWYFVIFILNYQVKVPIQILLCEVPDYNLEVKEILVDCHGNGVL